MKRSFWDKRIPTLIGLFIILIGTAVTTFLANKEQFGQVTATSSNQPQEVRITNITDASFSVSYTTENKTSGSINYGVDKALGQSALDDRDQVKGNLNQYTIHSITANNLSPSTKYYFTITSAGQTYTTNNELFEVTTGPSLTGTDETKNIMKGKIISSDGTPPSEAIIYITSNNLQVASVLTDSNGNYDLSLSKLRISDLSSFYDFSATQVIKMLAVGNSGKSNVILSYTGIDQIPTITLSKDYDFSQQETENATSSAAFENLLSFPTSTATKSAITPKILTPQEDEEFSSQQPIFKGTALPKQNVQIIIHSDEQIQANVTTDSSGNWTYKPSTPLSPGTHTISIITKNSAGILQTLTQSFIVYADEIQPTVSVSPTPTPIEILPTQTSTISATPVQELPPTGNPSIIVIGIVGIVISILGGLLFLLTRGGI